MEIFSNSKTYGIFSTSANQKIIGAAEKCGAKVFQFPPPETEIINHNGIISLIKNRLKEFDWIIFPDIFSVDYFLELLKYCEIDLFELDNVQILALGEAVSDRLRFSMIHADLVPNSLKTDEIISMFRDYLGFGELPEMKLLLPKVKGFDHNLKSKLSETGAHLRELEIYQIKYVNGREHSKLKALLAGGAIDEFIFTASEDVFFLAQILFPKMVPEVLAGVRVLANNEYTMQTLRENDLRPVYFSMN